MKKVMFSLCTFALASAVFVTSCKKDAKPGFTATPATVNVGDVVSFKDKESDRKNATFMYDFGDGSRSTERNPSHIYTMAGTFHVYQTVTVNKNAEKGKGFSQVATSDVIVTDPFLAPVADFTATPGTVAIGQPVTFTNNSTNATWYRWSWVSSTGTSWTGSYSEVKDMVLSFSDAGTYTVTLFADIINPNVGTVGMAATKSTAATKVATVTVTGTSSNGNAAKMGMLYGKWNFVSDVYVTSGFAAVTGGDAPVAGYKWLTSAAYGALSPNPFLHTSLTFNQDGTYNMIDPVGNQTSGSAGNWMMDANANYLNFSSTSGLQGSLSGFHVSSPASEMNEAMVGGTYNITALTASSLTLELKENCTACAVAANRTRTLTLSK